MAESGDNVTMMEGLDPALASELDNQAYPHKPPDLSPVLSNSSLVDGEHALYSSINKLRIAMQHENRCLSSRLGHGWGVMTRRQNTPHTPCCPACTPCEQCNALSALELSASLGMGRRQLAERMCLAAGHRVQLPAARGETCKGHRPCQASCKGGQV